MRVDPNVVVTAVVGMVGIILGTLLTAFLTEWRSRSAEDRGRRREHEAMLQARRLEAVRQTRRRVSYTVEQLKAAAISGEAFARRDADFEPETMA